VSSDQPVTANGVDERPVLRCTGCVTWSPSTPELRTLTAVRQSIRKQDGQPGAARSRRRASAGIGGETPERYPPVPRSLRPTIRTAVGSYFGGNAPNSRRRRFGGRSASTSPFPIHLDLLDTMA